MKPQAVGREGPFFLGTVHLIKKSVLNLEVALDKINGVCGGIENKVLWLALGRNQRSLAHLVKKKFTILPQLAPNPLINCIFGGTVLGSSLKLQEMNGPHTFSPKYFLAKVSNLIGVVDKGREIHSFVWL